MRKFEPCHDGMNAYDVCAYRACATSALRDASKERKDDEILPVELLEKFYDKAKNMDVPERMREFGIKADRADVIVFAAEIFLAVSKTVKTKRILVPGLGLADGIIVELAGNFRD